MCVRRLDWMVRGAACRACHREIEGCTCKKRRKGAGEGCGRSAYSLPTLQNRAGHRGAAYR